MPISAGEQGSDFLRGRRRTIDGSKAQKRIAELSPDPLMPVLAAADLHMHGCTGLWMSEESVGDAGASSLGYFGGCFSPDGSAIVAHGFTGALHLWRRAGVAKPTDK